MPTLWTRTLIPTARQPSAEAVVPSHQLMVRAGLIRQLGSGMYSYLPLGLRSLRKAMEIVREEMDAAGAVEVFMPTLQPIELWEQTGRRAAYGENLFVIKDRHDRELALGPTHEEVVTDLMQTYIESYRQLPITVYQVQTKFRDEFRPRFGVLRSREFQMKDAYSFDTTVEGLDRSYQAMYDAYCRIFARCGLPFEIVEAESGPIGGSASHEFMVPSPTGEDTILKSDRGNYAANVEKCETGPRPVGAAFRGLTRAAAVAGEVEAKEPSGALDEVHTPACPGIEDVCKALKVKPRHMLKTLLFAGEQGERILAVVRGDHEVNEAKLRRAVGGAIALADVGEARRDGFAIGFVGPHAAIAQPAVRVIVDPDATVDQFWVTGANKTDFHVKHFHWSRDLLGPLGAELSRRVEVADIRNAAAGDPSPRNDGGLLQETKGIEIGHVFKLGTKYTQALRFQVLGDDNQRRPVIMGCYGIGVNRILASALERAGGHDDKGIRWPAAIAPFKVLIVTIKHEGEVAAAAAQLAHRLESATYRDPHGRTQGVDVLIDDRDERPGVKFNDADLIGIPVRLTVGAKGLKDGTVELKRRDAEQAQAVPLDQAVERVLEALASL